MRVLATLILNSVLWNYLDIYKIFYFIFHLDIDFIKQL